MSHGHQMNENVPEIAVVVFSACHFNALRQTVPQIYILLTYLLTYLRRTHSKMIRKVDTTKEIILKCSQGSVTPLFYHLIFAFTWCTVHRSFPFVWLSLCLHAIFLFRFFSLILIFLLCRSSQLRFTGMFQG